MKIQFVSTSLHFSRFSQTFIGFLKSLNSCLESNSNSVLFIEIYTNPDRSEFQQIGQE